MEKKEKNIKYLNLAKGGKGYAIIQGFKFALKGNSDVIGFVDADGATPPQEAIRLIHNCENFDVSIGSRNLPQSKIIPNQSISRKIASKILNKYITLIFGWELKDTQCGAKFFRKKSLKNIINKIGYDGWAIDIDLLNESKKENQTIIEVPITWYAKPGSKVSILKTGVELFFSIIKIRSKTL